MNNGKITLLPEQMRAIARYEVTFTRLVPLPDDYDDIWDYVDIPEPYRYTLDDLYTAINNIIKNDPSIEELGQSWYYPVWDLEESFGIVYADGNTDTGDGDDDSGRIRGLPATREDIFLNIWSRFEDDWIFCDNEGDEHVSDISAFSEYLEEIELFFAEENMPVAERTFTDLQKKKFIYSFESDERVNNATQQELQLCRQFTEELCKRDSKTALHLKGYACYGGNKLYPCDWPVSRDCILRLYELTDNPQYANTLGYIYYYGRCTDGVPEYEKAFEMFTVSAANGLYEGMYKLADMFRHGYACKKSPDTAKKLYELVYNDSLSGFIKGQDNSFADAAVRMGNIYLRGTGVEPDCERAYGYYLQADFANRRRMENSDFFGNTTVAINIRKSLDEVKAQLDEDFFREYIDMYTPYYLYRLLEGNNRVSLSVEMKADGNAIIRAQRIPLREGRKVDPVFIVEPRLNLCKICTEIELQVNKAAVSFPYTDGRSYKVDCAEWDEDKQCVSFYFGDALVGTISGESFRIYGLEKSEPNGELIRLVGVKFQPGGRSYDYLCEDDTVGIGDKVVVPGYSGETTVEVTNVYTRHESELPIPRERYKKVIRKV